MTTHIIFDVDNTITPPRGKVQDTMQGMLNRLFDDPYAQVYFVSGSDLEQMKKQLGSNNCLKATNVFGSSGSEDRTGVHFTWTPPQKLIDYLKKELEDCPYPIRMGHHIDIRVGSINFSMVGRFAKDDMRKHYAEWDKQSGYRKDLRKRLLEKFPEIQVDIGGEISVDIYPIGHGKEQILNSIPIVKPNDIVIFFGDKMYEGGNDFTLAKKILDEKLGTVYTVKNWVHTYELLKELF